MASQPTQHLVRTCAFAFGIFAGVSAFGSDSGPLIDLLVSKGIIDDQEAEDLRADLAKDFAAQPAGKLNLGTTVSQFRISGDFRFRTDWDHQELKPSAPSSVGAGGGIGTGTFGSTANTTDSRTRHRVRFRVNFDMLFPKDWFGGFGLQTTQSADSGNETFRDGFENMGVFLSRAYVGWRPVITGDYNLTLTGGKQRNPLYFTDLVWDGDINPQGFSEVLSWRPTNELTVDFNAGQFLYADNPEWPTNRTSAGNDSARRNSWMFAQQAVLTYNFGKEDPALFSYARIAPGFTFYNNADKRLGANATTFTNAQAFPASTSGGGLFGVTSHLAQLTLTGEVLKVVSFMPTQPWRVYFDLAYNLSGEDRLHRTYGIPTSWQSDSTDDLAYLVGFRIGQGSIGSSSAGRFAGDWVFDVSYRHIGAGSIDPNINDSDFGLSRLNMQGWKAVIGYNFFEFVTGNLTWMQATDVQDELGRRVYSNAASRGLFDREQTTTLLADLSVKF